MNIKQCIKDIYRPILRFNASSSSSISSLRDLAGGGCGVGGGRGGGGPDSALLPEAEVDAPPLLVPPVAESFGDLIPCSDEMKYV